LRPTQHVRSFLDKTISCYRFALAEEHSQRLRGQLLLVVQGGSQIPAAELLRNACASGSQRLNLPAAEVVVTSRGGVTQGTQLGQRVAVFGSVGVLLGRDDVLQSRRPDRETGPSDDRCSLGQVLVRQQTAVGACEP